MPIAQLAKKHSATKKKSAVAESDSDDDVLLTDLKKTVRRHRLAGRGRTSPTLALVIDMTIYRYDDMTVSVHPAVILIVI